MYYMNGSTPEEIKPTTFADLGKREKDIEELLRKNIDIICGEEESLLVVGQQVRNTEYGRSDLTAMDHNGNIVLIEIKRDRKDIEHRREAFEFQAIRYAASFAMIQDTDELIQNIFAPYVEKHKAEFSSSETLTTAEIAHRTLEDFVAVNNIRHFNERQRIILVASEFDRQTLSAVAWLNSNQADLSCYQMTPYTFQGNVLLDVKKILPLQKYTDFYVGIPDQPELIQGQSATAGASRKNLPRIEELMQSHVIQAGARLRAKGRDSEAVLQENGQVQIQGNEEITSLQQWLKGVYGWSSVETYAFAVDEDSGKTLAELRAEYMKANGE